MKLKLNVLTENDIERVHEASIKIMEETGVVFQHDEALDIFRKHGAKIVDKTVYISREMVEKALETCPKTFKWTGRNDERSVTVGDGFLIQPNFGCIYTQDLDNGRRLGTLKDFANFQKLSQASDICSLVGAVPVNPSDIDHTTKHFYMMYEAIKNTDKPLCGYGIGTTKEISEMMDIVSIAMGGNDFLRENHCVATGVHALSPLIYAPETLETIIEYAKRNQILFVLPCILAGVTGPMSPMGTVVTQNVEILSAIVLIQLINPGSPVVYAPGSTAAYMKTASYIVGPPEMTLINNANIQMGSDFYQLPTRTMTGMSDSKAVDAQAGYETMQSNLMSMLAGCNIVYQNMGVLDALMTTSYEKFIIDEEIISRCWKICEGLDTSDDALSIDVIKEVGPGGTYLTHPNTFAHFRDNWGPTVSEWNSYDDWKAAGAEDIVVKANRKFKEILNNAPEMMIDPEMDKELKNYIELTLAKR